MKRFTSQESIPMLIPILAYWRSNELRENQTLRDFWTKFNLPIPTHTDSPPIDPREKVERFSQSPRSKIHISNLVRDGNQHLDLSPFAPPRLARSS
jgi:hypothetical protein